MISKLSDQKKNIITLFSCVLIGALLWALSATSFGSNKIALADNVTSSGGGGDGDSCADGGGDAGSCGNSSDGDGCCSC